MMFNLIDKLIKALENANKESQNSREIMETFSLSRLNPYRLLKMYPIINSNEQYLTLLLNEDKIWDVYIKKPNVVEIITIPVFIEGEFANLFRVGRKLRDKGVFSIKVYTPNKEFNPENFVNYTNKKGFYQFSILVNSELLGFEDEVDFIRKIKKIVNKLFKLLEEDVKIYYVGGEEFKEKLNLIMPKV